MRADVAQGAPVFNGHDLRGIAGPFGGQWLEVPGDRNNAVASRELPTLDPAVIGTDHRAGEAQPFRQQLRGRDAVKVLHPLDRSCADCAGRLNHVGLRFSRRVAGDDDVRPHVDDQLGRRLAVADVVESPFDQRTLLVLPVYVDAGETQPCSVVGPPLERALRPGIAGEIGMGNFMAAPGQLPAQIDLEGVAGIVVDEHLHISREIMRLRHAGPFATRQWLLRVDTTPLLASTNAPVARSKHKSSRAQSAVEQRASSRGWPR